VCILSSRDTSGRFAVARRGFSQQFQRFLAIEIAAGGVNPFSKHIGAA
jgi:hypothetical protein